MSDPWAGGASSPAWSGPSDRDRLRSPDAVSAELGDQPVWEGDGPRFVQARFVGEGGMGRVEAVTDRRLGRDVARKTLRTTDPALAARLVREAKLTAALDHPGIVPVYDAGVDTDGRPWYTMALVRGQSLADLLRSEAAGPRVALVSRVLAVAQAVAYAHDHGVVHRDLKPDNMMVGPRGETLVVDWGLAAAAGEDRGTPSPSPSSPTAPVAHEGLTRVGDRMGTPRWWSPEQARGDAADTRSDVYSLGLVLRAVLSSSKGGIPADLESVVARATQADPAGRYPHAGAMARDLEAWLQGRPVAAHAYSLPERMARGYRRWRPAVAVVGGLAVLALINLGLSWRETAMERDRAVLAESETKALLGELDTELAIQAAKARDPYLYAVHAQRAAKVRQDAVGAGLLAAMPPVVHRPERVQSWNLPPSDRLVARTDGMVVGGPEGVFWSTGPETSRKLFDQPVKDLDVDGDQIVVRSVQRLHRVGLDGTTEALPYRARVLGHHNIRAPKVPGLSVLNPTRSDVVVRVRTDGASIADRCPSGVALTSVFDGEASWVPCSGGTLLRYVDDGPPEVVPMVLSRGSPETEFVSAVHYDGILYMGTISGALQRLDLQTFQLSWPWSLTDVPLEGLALSPSGDRLAASGTRKTWVVDNRTWGVQAALPQGAETVAWRGEDRVLLGRDGEAAVWDVGPPTPPMVFENAVGLSALSVGPAGVAVGDAAGDVALLHGEPLQRSQAPRMADVTIKSVDVVSDVPTGPWLWGADIRGRVLRWWPGQAPTYMDAGENARRLVALGAERALVGGFMHDLVPLTLGQPNGTPLGNDGVRHLDRSGDRSTVLLVREDRWLSMRDVATGAERVLVDGPERGIADLSDDGSTVVGADHLAVRVYDARTGLPRAVHATPRTPTAVAVSPDGALVAWGLEDGTVFLAGTGGAVRWTAQLHTGRVSGLAFDAARGMLWSISWDGTLRRWTLEV